MVIFTFIAALLTVVGSIIATVMFIIFRNTITSQDTVNIKGQSSRASPPAKKKKSIFSFRR